MSRIDPNDRTAFLTAHPEWIIDGEELRRTFRFADFSAATAFVVRVALAAERADHHPDIDIRWNTVTLALSTHSAGVLTERDTALADEIDRFA